MITLKNLSKYYNRHKKNELHVINNTSLEFEDSGLVALLGPSGCGKTTLLNCIGGLDTVNSGSIEINGIKITKNNFYKMDKIRNLNIGYVFQDYKLIDDLTVFENVSLALKMCGVKDKGEIKRRVDAILNVVELYRYKNRPAAMLSGGERQRVGIARALVKNPSLVICDEPTGNLDSRNSIEIMNIIKAISREKLVILVTHETNLANLYADKIISIEDGCVKSIKDNDSSLEIDYEIDGKIYLKDLDNHQVINNDYININFYSDTLEKININLVYKNNKLYIESDELVENINEESPFELIDDHYKKIDKTIYEKYNFEIEEIKNKKNASLYNILSMLKVGFYKVKNYSKIRKLSLASYFVAGALILYSFSQVFGAMREYMEDYNFDDSMYIKVSDKDIKKHESEILSFKEVNFMYPSNMKATFTIPVNDFFQTNFYSQVFESSLGSSVNLNESDLLYGRIPNENEVVVDKRVFDAIFEDALNINNLALIGIDNPEKLIGRKIIINSDKTYTIVGISNKNIKEVFLNNNDIEREVYQSSSFDSITNYGYNDIYYVKDEITITEGREPNKNEVLVSEELKAFYPLNKKSDLSLNSTKLTVVGYYKSNSITDNIINIDTIKDFIYSQTFDFVISSNDKENTLKELRKLKLNGEDLFYKNYNEYKNSRKKTIKTTVTVTSVIFGITLIEVFFVIRASFQSRIKEVGILRAIGVKRRDIYKMFAGEIIVGTTFAGLTGILITYAFIYALSDIKMIARAISSNPTLILLAMLVLYAFNIFVGLLPVWATIRTTPARILSRKDI